MRFVVRLALIATVPFRRPRSCYLAQQTPDPSPANRSSLAQLHQSSSRSSRPLEIISAQHVSLVAPDGARQDRMRRRAMYRLLQRLVILYGGMSRVWSFGGQSSGHFVWANSAARGGANSWRRKLVPVCSTAGAAPFHSLSFFSVFFFSFFVLSMHQVDGTGAASGLPNSEVKTPACLSGGPPLAAAPRPTPSAALSRIFAAAFTLEKSESTPAREISSMMLQIPRGQKATIRRWAAVQPRLPGRPRPLETANIMPWGAFYFPYRSISV